MCRSFVHREGEMARFPAMSGIGVATATNRIRSWKAAGLEFQSQMNKSARPATVDRSFSTRLQQKKQPP